MEFVKQISPKIYIPSLAAIAALYFWFSSSENEVDILNDEEIIPHTPPGLVNFGNICFVNSSLQALSSIKSFREFLNSLLKNCADLKSKNDPISLNLIVQLQKILTRLNREQSDSLSSEDLLEQLKKLDHYLNYQDQQDAHELIVMIFEAISKVFQVNSVNLNNMSLSGIHKLSQENSHMHLENLEYKPKREKNGVCPIQGLISRCYECCSCFHKFNIKLEAFNCLSVDIVQSGILTVIDCLKYFLKEEIIEDVVCINCSLRRHLEKMTDHYFIQKDNEIIAKFLQDQIKFIKFLIEQTSRMLLEQEDIEIKIMNLKEEQSKKVPLDFEIFCIHFKRLVNIYGELNKSNKYIDFPEKLDLNAINSKEKYLLKSIIMHHGISDYGHYITVRKLENKWFHISDENVSELSYNNSFEDYKSKAYMLFYERI